MSELVLDKRSARYVRPAVLALLAGWGAVATLAFLVWLLPRLPEPLWPIPLMIAAAPLAHHLVEWRLAKRRALVAGFMHEEGLVRAWLWKGGLLQIGAALAAAMMMTALYLAATFLEWQHWVAVAACPVLLALASAPFRSALRSEVETAHLGMMLRHGPLFWVGAGFLGATFLGLGFVLDQPDLRGESFAAILGNAYAEGTAGVQAASLQVLLGAGNAIQMGVWYWAQIVGTQLDTAAAWLFWLIVLLVTGGIASFLSAYVLAGIGLAERAGRSAARMRPFQFAFLATLAVIGIIYVAISASVPRLSLDPSRLPSRVVAHLDPCSTSRAAAEQAVAKAGDELSHAADQEALRTRKEIEAAVNDGFSSFELAVDAYLDWYFSLSGEYARIWKHLFGDGAAYLAGKFDEMVLARATPRLAEELSAIESRSVARMQAMASRHSEQLRSVIEGSRCLAVAQSDIPAPAAGEGPQHVYGAVSGSAAGVAVGLAVGARPLAKRLIGRTALKRGVSATGGAAAGAAICSPSGPAAILCGVVAGVGTWIAIDVLVLWGDEYLNREGMRKEIMEALDGTRRELIDSLTAANTARIATAVDRIRTLEAQLFSPIHEGVGRPRQATNTSR